ncbi:uncharacterized protein PHALS_04180 [Plasmopara halstedii]|uniref:Uncharacterized protein n=1 Tax=Plasmopara halstedii TaxID=4781 RepID=A0A0P1A8A6_PLAHL|nr:uncharacterized protein PHALS_04180 [Plasmopara halstedii]CEG36929.1 hypothetical protein PHALS_04180 [Plasmopara halstedii]|eukprot:XP_024573298.1 hypothetical protein PHALS_04180 [Plasmopara halstedii]
MSASIKSAAQWRALDKAKLYLCCGATSCHRMTQEIFESAWNQLGSMLYMLHSRDTQESTTTKEDDVVKLQFLANSDTSIAVICGSKDCFVNFQCHNLYNFDGD